MTYILKHDINSHRREYFIKEVNGAIVKAIEAISKTRSFLGLVIELATIAWSIKKYPEPTIDNVLDLNVKLLLETYREYCKLEQFDRVRPAVWLLVKIAAVKIEHSPNYRDRASWWVEKLAPKWRRRALNHPRNGWAEKRPYGGAGE